MKTLHQAPKRDSTEIKTFIEKELAGISRGGNVSHEAFIVTSIHGLGYLDLAVVDPPVVALSNRDDTFYTQYFRSRGELEKFISELRAVADQAWP